LRKYRRRSGTERPARASASGLRKLMTAEAP
jgi:hypothetical protein